MGSFEMRHAPWVISLASTSDFGCTACVPRPSFGALDTSQHRLFSPVCSTVRNSSCDAACAWR